MAKKQFHFGRRDTGVRCRVCNRPLKSNVVERKRKEPELCYKHWLICEFSSGKLINSKRAQQARMGRKLRPDG